VYLNKCIATKMYIIEVTSNIVRAENVLYPTILKGLYIIGDINIIPNNIFKDLSKEILFNKFFIITPYVKKITNYI
jgi:hypothetical protein